MTAATDRPSAEGRVWEPYTFTVNDRVRIRLSLECPAQFYAIGLDGLPVSPETTGHDWTTDGVIGVVDMVHRQAFGRHGLPSRGHFYRVSFASGFGYFAAIELEPTP